MLPTSPLPADPDDAEFQAPQVLTLELDRLRPRPDQPRRYFDLDALDELAASMARVGVLHPLLVRPAGDGDDIFEIVSGERRWRAARRLGWDWLPALVTRGDVDEIALIENLQRQDLNALEEAAALQRLMDKHHYTQDALGRAIGRTQGQISSTLRLLTLHPDILQGFPQHERLVSRSMLVELATIDEPERQLALWERACQGSLTVRAIRAEKAGDAPANPATAGLSNDKVTVALRHVDRTVTALEQLQVGPSGLTDGQRAHLSALSRRITALMG
ncbi:ParB/RepB/Spo0J family partition protein [Niveispirillum sp. KHB5.9]|uniref:ParB/RepB/Spo0J family partition protein n=1 Tax=Niveispirillum sp. KHB5.9 TaxID=3400269 RepID=UPI003A8B5CAB